MHAHIHSHAHTQRQSHAHTFIHTHAHTLTCTHTHTQILAGLSRTHYTFETVWGGVDAAEAAKMRVKGKQQEKELSFSIHR